MITPCPRNLPAPVEVPDARPTGREHRGDARVRRASLIVTRVNPFLHATLVDIESHVAAAGWDQPTRFYALVETATLLREEPTLAESFLAAGIASPPAFTPVEQEDFPDDMPLDDVLASITWGPQVSGCAIAVERLVLPADVEVTVPHDSPEMPAFVAEHPERQEIRIVAVVLRNGARDCALRMRSKDEETEVLFGAELAPGLLEALLGTFTEYEEGAEDEGAEEDHGHDHEHGEGCKH